MEFNLVCFIFEIYSGVYLYSINVDFFQLIVNLFLLNYFLGKILSDQFKPNYEVSSFVITCRVDQPL